MHRFLLPQLHLLHLFHPHPVLQLRLLLLFHPHLLLLSLLHLLHAHSAPGGPDLSGCQSNGQSHSATDRSESPLQLFLLQMRKMVTLMTPLTSLTHSQLPLLSQQHRSSPSSSTTKNCGTELVRKRWRLIQQMALGRSSNCLLGSMQLAQDGS